MRYKIVPEPRPLSFVDEVQAAVPLVPGSVEDCCTRIRDATDLASRDAAREWLTFVEALELVEETPRGYRRLQRQADPDHLAVSFRERVFGARELLDALADTESITVDEAFDALRESVPTWERDRHTDWEDEWRERTRRLLEWGVRFGLVERVDDDESRYAMID